jgi:hypothetical protein
MNPPLTLSANGDTPGESIADTPDSKKEDFRGYHCSASFAHHCL